MNKSVADDFDEPLPGDSMGVTTRDSRPSSRVKRGAFTLFGVLTVVGVASACGDDSSGVPAGVSIDTLANGAVHVRNGSEGLWAARGREPWTLVEDLRIGALDGAGPDVFGSVRNVLADEMGRIWVMDSQAQELRQFAPDGTYIRTVGGPGEGPGEFGFNPCADRGPDGEIWVEAGRRWQRFDSAGNFLGGQPSTGTTQCGIRAWRGSQFIGVRSVFDPATEDFASSMVMHERGPDGNLVPGPSFPVPTLRDGETFEWRRPDGRPFITLRVPFAHSPGYPLSSDGDFWVSQGGGEYRLQRQTVEGDTLLIVERTYEPVPIPPAMRDSAIAVLDDDERGFPDDFDAARVPTVFPPFDRTEVARDGTLWLRRHVEGGAYSFDVFDAAGIYLGAVPIPSSLGRLAVDDITGEYIYGVTTDALGVSYAVRVRIEK